MIDRHLIFDIHRLADQALSVRKIAKSLGVSRPTVSKYLDDPNPKRPMIVRPSKLDPFKEDIERMLDLDPKASAMVILQRLQEKGYDGGSTILRDYLSRVRPRPSQKQAFIRFESPAGMQCQIDWGHFGHLDYGNTTRKLYGFAVIECHSRMLYVEFTHSQHQQSLHRALLNAFRFFQGSPKELVHDNMLTAVIEHQGPVVRFNEQFLEFLRPFHITPIACHIRQPQEKGKVEKGAMHYIRHNFFPLRTFTSLDDLQAQANHWRDQVANRRVHNTTGQRPIDRFRPEAMRPLPEFLPDCRDHAVAKVHTDFCVPFDGNTYSAPPWAIGKTLTVKADHHHVMLYFKDKAIATHQRCWQRKQRLERPEHRLAATQHRQRHWRSQQVATFIALGEVAKNYLEQLATTGQPLQKSVKKLLDLKDDYGTYALLQAMERATEHGAFGAHYIENILYQDMTPQRQHPPVRLKHQHLNSIRLDEPSLAEFDTFILKRKGAKAPSAHAVAERKRS
jgi:transposase